MSDFCRFHGIPRAGIDRIDDEMTALALLTTVLDNPLTPQVIAVILDAERVGHSILVVHEADSPDAVLDVAEVVTESIPEPGAPAAAEVLLASVRPDGHLESRDGDRWLEIGDILAQRGAAPLEWFVVTESEVICPRDLLGIPPRWGLRSSHGPT